MCRKYLGIIGLSFLATYFLKYLPKATVLTGFGWVFVLILIALLAILIHMASKIKI